ncbi:hypothetical protein, unlikely [Trypanosoma brucei gambiense DAL972]|uniref:Uncharacterized protein n=1 Tax=Trypanosoma brucei gambiense (strain MHOM/CI/86/DAL972) TaxID=679716 RepID=C9ZHZ3_TRYB9|nr:hypothetical protein, unlikely [Trypanosoma brucei gambiense DAL972]CBH09110.1 hypothetical protein, unlikely [Trypanosoma brucei gambiense DAL972]|eukprot:XP_011771551.1 hypothetical protein, unlikely [Trypanosoma brucei gambiense DAL972]
MHSSFFLFSLGVFVIYLPPSLTVLLPIFGLTTVKT